MKRILFLIVLLTCSFECSADIKRWLKKTFCCCLHGQPEGEASLAEFGTDGVLEFVEAVGADGEIQNIPVVGLTPQEAASKNALVAAFNHIARPPYVGNRS